MTKSMAEDDFWKLINNIDGSELDSLEEGYYPEDQLEPLVSSLSKLSAKEIEDFEDKLSYFLYNLDGQKYADHAGESGESDDGFLYACCWVVAKGKNHYETVLANPKIMPKEISQWCEPSIYVASKAWALSTGNDDEDWGYTPK